MTTVHTNPATGVLIVDDHDGYRSVATEVVNATQGFVVVGSACDREEALWLIAVHHDDVDLILMDVHLGQDDGVNLTREIVEHGVCADVVIVSALAMDDLPTAAHQCGARAYLPKSELSPMALTELCRGVYDWPDVHPASGASR